MNLSADPAALAALLLDALPQTQCTRCGYPDCAAYAAAIAQGEAEINQCPPGGAEGVRRLADIIAKPARPLNPAFGAEGPRKIAFIDEAWCIGCTLCLDVCPTDAIVGSNKRMHTVIETHCTGCELCLPVCPVDCILLEDTSVTATGWAAWSPEQAASARRRYAKHLERIRLQIEAADPVQSSSAQPKESVIEAALARARQLRDNSSRT